MATCWEEYERFLQGVAAVVIMESVELMQTKVAVVAAEVFGAVVVAEEEVEEGDAEEEVAVQVEEKNAFEWQ